MLAVATSWSTAWTLNAAGSAGSTFLLATSVVSMPRLSDVRMEEEDKGAWSSLDKNNGAPEGLVSRMIWKGPGLALLFYIDEMREKFEKADTDGDGYLSTADAIELMKDCGDEFSEDQVMEMMATIEKVQGLEKRDAEGGPLIFFQQWTKYMNDFAREEKKKK